MSKLDRRAAVVACLFFLNLVGGLGGFLEAQVGSKLEAVRQRGKMVVGINPNQLPYGLLGGDGKWTGFDAELAREMARRLGVELEIVQVTPQSRIPMLKAGKVDALIAGLAYSPKRAEEVDFSIPYVAIGERLLVKKGSNVRSAEDLRGKTVAAVQGSLSEEVLRKTQPEAKLLRFQELPQAFLALKRGLADAFVSSVDILSKLAAGDKEQEYEIVGPDLHTVYAGIGVPKGDSRWLDKMNTLLLDMEKDGTYATIFNKYFGKDSEFKLPVPKLGPMP